MKDESSQQLLKSVGKAIDVLFSFLDGPSAKTLGEISQKIGLGKSTMHRLLGTLKEKGLIEQETKTGNYRLGIKILHLSSKVLANIDIRDLARPYLEELSRLMDESSHLAYLTGWEAVFIDKVQASTASSVRMTSFVGRVVPLYCTSVGKILLAAQDISSVEAYLASIQMIRYTPYTISGKEELLEELKKIRLQGYSVDHGEYTEGLMCLGTGISGPRAATRLAISVSGPQSRMEEKAESLVPHLKKAAQNISRDIVASGLDPGWEGA